MKLLPSAGSDRAWVWTVQADFADEEAKAEQLAIRFKNAESKRHFMHPLTSDYLATNILHFGGRGSLIELWAMDA